MAGFIPMEIGRAKDFLRDNHWGVLATRRKNGSLQMSPVTCGLDSGGCAVISSRETAYKVNNLRRDPRAALCAFTTAFHGEGWVQISGSAKSSLYPMRSILWFTYSDKPTANRRVGQNFTSG